MSNANGTTLRQFYRAISGGHYQIDHDIDRNPQPVVEGLLHTTGLSQQMIEDLSLRPLRLNLHHSTATRFGRLWILAGQMLQCCPDCLYETEDPYYRRAWRLSFMTVCPKHQTLLIDRCPACGQCIRLQKNSVATARNDVTVDKLAHCSWCDFDFRELSFRQYEEQDIILERGDFHHGRHLKRSRSQPTLITRRSGYFQASLFEAVIQGHYKFKTGQKVAGREFFRGLSHLSRLLTHLPKAQKWRHTLHCQENSFRVDLAPVSSLSIDKLPLEERHNILIALSWLFNDWPQRFHDICVSSGATKMALSNGGHDIPQWLRDEINQHTCEIAYPFNRRWRKPPYADHESDASSTNR